jgi:hypothetical protein
MNPQNPPSFIAWRVLFRNLKSMKSLFPWLFFCLISPMFAQAQDEKPQAIERACPNVFSFSKHSKIYSFRYASNHSISAPNNKIRQLVIYIHGARRNGQDYYEWGEKAVNAAHKQEETLFFSPQFNSEKDLEDHKHDATHLFWVKNNWRIGDESVSSEKRVMADSFSSFSLIDSVIARACNKKLFPNLKRITVVGHSAGGQFVSRYVGMTPLPNVLTTYQFNFIVMNPSTYLYLDERRPVQSDKGLVFIKPNSTDCSSFNDYPRGMDKLNPYAAQVGVETITKQFLNRDISYILGEKDVNMNDSSLDKSCEGNMQGRFRLERGQFYYAYLQLFAKNKQVHQMDVVPDVAHDGDKMINSHAARMFLFGK